MRRREFVAATAAAAVAQPSWSANAKPAALGGAPVRTKAFPSWPRFDDTEEHAVVDTLRTGKWNRSEGKQVAKFEQAYANLTGAAHCLGTANGTSALICTLTALGVGPGDEVIVPPYTFVATINAVLTLGAIPVFVDSDRQTFQIDARKVEAAITPDTVAIMPVHLGGNAADLDTLTAIAKRRNLPLVEDACQAHLAEWKGRKVGTYGLAGCFSFQASKNLNSGEGGAVLTSDSDFVERCYAVHNNGRGRKGSMADFSYAVRGANLRMPEFQGALLIAQMTRLEKQSQTRDENAKYLTGLLDKIPGITPARQYPGCTRNAWHLYMFRYDAAQFDGLTRDQFLKALRAEGIPGGSGYKPLNREPFLEQTLRSRGFARVLPADRFSRWREHNQCPENDRLCAEAVWFTQTMLLGDKTDMDQIAEAIAKIKANATALKSA